MGQSSLDLSKSLGTSSSSGSTPSSTSGNGSGSGNSNGSGGSNSGGTSDPLTKREKMIIAHAIICVIAFLFLLPLGALVARYFRTSTTVWFKAHQAIQSFLAAPLIVIGFALGVAVVSDLGGSHFNSTHTVCHELPLHRSQSYLNRDFSDLDSDFSSFTSSKSSSATLSTCSSPNPLSDAARLKTISTRFLGSLSSAQPFIRSVLGTRRSTLRSPAEKACQKPPISCFTSGPR